MKVTFLGTGTSTGIPLIGSNHPVCHSSDLKDKRLRSSILIQWDDYSYIVDTGPDFRQQMLKVGCNRIDGVLYTKIIEPKSASYGVSDPYMAIIQLAQTTMRSEIGKIPLDQTFEDMFENIINQNTSCINRVAFSHTPGRLAQQGAPVFQNRSLPVIQALVQTSSKSHVANFYLEWPWTSAD